MLNEIIDQTILFIFSFLATFFASVSGGGSGFIQFPLLLFMGLPFATALGTHKLAIVFLGMGSIAKQKIKPKMIDKTVAILLLAIGFPSVILGTLIVVSIPETIAKIALGCIIAAFGIFTFLKKDFGQAKEGTRKKSALIIGSICIFLTGMLSGSLSSGTGIFVTMTLVLVFGLDLKRAIMHTMIFVSTIWNGIGAVTVGMVTAIYWQWVPCLVISSFAGAYFGTTLLMKLPLRAVRLVFSIVAVCSGIALIISSL